PAAPNPPPPGLAVQSGRLDRRVLQQLVEDRVAHRRTMTSKSRSTPGLDMRASLALSEDIAIGSGGGCSVRYAGANAELSAAILVPGPWNLEVPARKKA